MADMLDDEIHVKCLKCGREMDSDEHIPYFLDPCTMKGDFVMLVFLCLPCLAELEENDHPVFYAPRERIENIRDTFTAAILIDTALEDADES